MVKMDAGWKEAWVKALRGGLYKQGRGKLRSNEDTFCCLGVLCDITGLGVWLAPSAGALGDQYLPYQTREDGQMDAAYLPGAVVDATGVTGPAQNKLTDMNDGGPKVKQASFAEIADWIEKEL